MLFLLFSVQVNKYFLCPSRAEGMVPPAVEVDFLKYTLIGKKWCVHKQVKRKTQCLVDLCSVVILSGNLRRWRYHRKSCEWNEIWKAGIGKDRAEGSWQEPESWQWGNTRSSHVDHNWSFTLGWLFNILRLSRVKWDIIYSSRPEVSQTNLGVGSSASEGTLQFSVNLNHQKR